MLPYVRVLEKGRVAAAPWSQSGRRSSSAIVSATSRPRAASSSSKLRYSSVGSGNTQSSTIRRLRKGTYRYRSGLAPGARQDVPNALSGWLTSAERSPQRFLPSGASRRAARSEAGRGTSCQDAPSGRDSGTPSRGLR